MNNLFYLDYASLFRILRDRLAEPAPSRIQLLSGPRQVGKTSLLTSLAQDFGNRAIYVSLDGPEASIAGFWERLWADAERLATEQKTKAERERSGGDSIIVFLDEIQQLPDWSARLKGEWDRIKRENLPIHVVASGSSSLALGAGSKESLAGRFERLTLPHWTPAALAQAFDMNKDDAIDTYVSQGAYPGSMGLRNDANPQRFLAYLREAIIEPAIGRDILSLEAVRRPALLRQVFAIAVTIPAQVISLQKLQGQLQDKGALATIAHYLDLLEDAFLIAPLHKFTNRPLRQREAPPKIVVLNNALCAALDRRPVPTLATDPQRYGHWVENACLARLWNQGIPLFYWRESGLEVDAVIDNGESKWAIEVKTGSFGPADLAGLFEFTRQYPEFRPLLLCGGDGLIAAKRFGIQAQAWRDFLWQGLPTVQ